MDTLSELPVIVGQTIEAIASKLEVPAKYLLTACGKGVMVEGLGMAFAGAVLSYLAIKTLTFGVKHLIAIEAETRGHNPRTLDGKDWGGIICFIMGIVLTCISVGLLLDRAGVVARMIFAPEYHLILQVFANIQ